MGFFYTTGKFFLCLALILHGLIMITDAHYKNVMEGNLNTIAKKYSDVRQIIAIIAQNIDTFKLILGIIQISSFINIFRNKGNFIPILNILVLLILSVINSNPLLEDDMAKKKFITIDLLKNLAIVGGLIYMISTQKSTKTKGSKAKSD